MSEEWKKYVEDPRTVCKYATKCYQKNAEHHRQFKHPPRIAKRKSPHNHHNDKKMRTSPSSHDNNGDQEQGTSKDVIIQPIDEAETKNSGGSKSLEEKVVSNTSNEKRSPAKFDIPENLTYYEASKKNYEKIKELFLTEMPDDFFKLFECFKNDDEDMEKVLSRVNLQPIGPYELLLGKLPVLHDKELYLVHWRFFYDPPEFQSILKVKGRNEYHLGYYRDAPDEAPVFVASNDSAKCYTITPVASNVFGAIFLHLQAEKKKSPFTAMACQKLIDKIKHWAESNNYSLEEFNMRKRVMQANTKTVHGAGILVPFDKKTKVGYRQLVESDATIKKLFTKLASVTSESEKDKLLSELQPVITYASIAVDECDFGAGLECGIDLFCSGLKELHPSALSLLNAVYGLLKREAFAKIIQAHLKYRRKGPDMSIISAN